MQPNERGVGLLSAVPRLKTPGSWGETDGEWRWWARRGSGLRERPELGTQERCTHRGCWEKKELGVGPTEATRSATTWVHKPPFPAGSGCTSRPSQLGLGSSGLPLLSVLLLVTTRQDWSLAVLQGPCLTPEDSLPHSLWGYKGTWKSKGKCRTQKLMSADGRKEKAPHDWARAGGFGVQAQVGPLSPHLHKSQCLTRARLETQGLSRKTSRGDRGKPTARGTVQIQEFCVFLTDAHDCSYIVSNNKKILWTKSALLWDNRECFNPVGCRPAVSACRQYPLPLFCPSVQVPSKLASPLGSF